MYLMCVYINRYKNRTGSLFEFMEMPMIVMTNYGKILQMTDIIVGIKYSL